MAQPSYAIEYLGAVEVQGGVSVSSSTISTAFPSATVLKMKTKDVKVSIDGGVQFDVVYDDESFLNSATPKTYVFNKDCIIAVGIYKVVV